ncbi:alpha-L-fucosidase 3 [Heracleum sosnowskyi]|uniref:Alpha-L-fucosidase 3 n=1 Tax=Heracleum sosnowskyi TaxID=360622 RepID=A0AAD8IL06_9APIA|nr:alpha-L-fucosidase 3 [Heracleum sosnowskyi]
MNKLSFSLLSIYVFVIAVISPVFAATDCRFPAIFNFGDGNSDTGGFTATFGSSPQFYGQTFFNGPSGRSSDGRLIIDFIASSLGKKFLHSYLDSLGADFSQGANFAQLLATAGVPQLIIPKDSPPFGFNPVYYGVQFAEFVNFVDRSQRIRNQGGKFRNLMPRNESFAKGLYTFDIGQNDLAQGLFTNTSIDDIKKSLPALINSFTATLKNLYNLFGARTFWIHNTGPLGCYPYILTILPTTDVDSAGCSKAVNELAQSFNSVLKSAVDQLRSELPEAAVTYVDIYSAYYSLYTEPQKYGFERPLEACCGLGGTYNFGALTCGSTATVNGTQITAGPCKDPSKRINWDGFTYTEAANKIIFEKLASGNFSDPPNSPGMACRRN